MAGKLLMTGLDPFRRRRAIEPRSVREGESDPHTPLGEGPEFDAIRRALERWGPRARRIGDDAALVTMTGDRSIVASTDVSIENVHFRPGWLSPREIGYRATIAALSDLAAMGAAPLGVLAAVGIPEVWRRHLDALTDGIGDAAASVDAPIIGGDMSRAGELSLAITVIGSAREVLFRTAARPGDTVYVTGRLGGPLKALRELEKGREPEAADRARFATPSARIRESIWLAEHGAAAAIDISDGLAADLSHLAAASRVVICAQLDKLAIVGGISPADAAASGEEYELVVTAPARFDVSEFGKLFDIELSEIGRVEHGPPEVQFYDGEERVPSPPGYSHFSEKALSPSHPERAE
ncbi:MAG: thiamine-phosphate kinase [Gemmatimonadaceae bacterium]